MELHTEITNKIRVFDAFKNLQFISCFFDGFVIIRLKSYLQDRFFIISPLFQITKEKNPHKTKTTHNQTTHPKPKHKPRKQLKNFYFLKTSIITQSPKIPPPPSIPKLNKKEHQTTF